MPKILAALVVFLFAVALPASAAALENDIGRIAYTSDRDGNPEIFTARLDGFGEQNLTNNPAVDQSPAWSADGSRIAFVSDRDGRMDIWVMNWDGSDQHKVTSGDSGGDFEPAWSPTGREIVFSSSRGDGSWHLWIVDLSDGSVRRLTPGWGTQPSWSPDGAHIAYAGTAEIRVVDADGTNDHQLTYCACTGPAGSPAWSRDGSFLVFGRYDDDWQVTNARQLYFVPANGGEGVALTSGPYYNDHPTFSPGGSMVLFQRQEGALRSPELYYMNLSDLVAHPSVTSPGRNFVPSWGPTFVAPPPAPPPADTTPPTITIRTPTVSGTDRMDVYTVGQVVIADYECSDSGSGVRHCVGPVADGESLDTRFIGTYEFRVFAADQAGNPVYKSAWYRVVYPFNGFAAPVANGALNDLRAGDSVPLKFSLGGNYGLDVVTGAAQQQIDCDSRAPLSPAAPAGGTLTYNASLDRYLYEWSSQKAWVGTCRSVALLLRDGTRHQADFRLVK